MGRLSTHVLDTTSGLPGGGVKIELSRQEGELWRPLKSVLTNAQGRTDEALLEGDDLLPGRYRLQFHVAAYFRRLGFALPAIPFLDIVPLEIGIADASLHYHVPLLCSPWSFTTYRGS